MSKERTSAVPRFEVPNWRSNLLAGFGCSPPRTNDGEFASRSGGAHNSARDEAPNDPQLRPIENFWRILKQGVYRGGWEVSPETMLRARITIYVKKLDTSVPRKMLEGLPKRVRQADRLGAGDLVHWWISLENRRSHVCGKICGSEIKDMYFIANWSLSNSIVISR